MGTKPCHMRAKSDAGKANLRFLRGAGCQRRVDETHEVGADHTVVVPPNVPHGFTAIGDFPAKIIGMFPAKDPFLRTKYLEGEPPASH